MFLPIFLFEIRYRLRRPATWIYFSLFFLLAFILMLGAAGAFGNGSVVLGGNTPNVHANAPGPINFYIAILSWFGVLVASALLGNGVYRDFEHRTHSLFFTTPITKWGYLGGRFLGSLVVAIGVFSALALGLWLGTYWPTAEAVKIGPNHLLYYLWPYVVIVVPNLIFVGSIVFTLATLTRNILSTYLAAIGLLIGYLVALSLVNSLDNKLLAAALDPFGASAVRYTTQYWTSVDQNTRLLPLSSYLMLNRALWLGIGLLLLGFCYVRFQFGAFATDKAVKGKPAPTGPTAESLTKGFAVATERLQLPVTTQHLGAAYIWQTISSLTRLEWRAIVRNVYFVAIVAAGVLFLIVNATQLGKIYDTRTYLVTGELVSSLSGQFGLFLFIIIVFYSGEAVWRDRDANLNQITDATPVPGWVPLVAKFLALGGVQLLLLAVIMVFGLLAQTVTGYTRYELDVYLTALLGLTLPGLLLTIVLALTIQSVVNHKYVGHMMLIIFYLFDIYRGNIGLSHNLFGYSYIPSPSYSALNGWGHFMPAVGAWTLHWSTVALLMLILAYLLWVRGTDTAFPERWKQVKRRFKGPAIGLTALATIAALGTGTLIYYNTNVLNHYRTEDQDEALQVEYEQRYGRFKYAPQPRISEVNLTADLYPAQRGARFRGFYWLVNRSGRALDSLHLEVSEDATIHSLAAATGSSNLVNDRAHNYRIERLQKPLTPGDSVKLSFDIEYRYRGFPNSGNNTSLVYNGTFINSTLLPHIGYSGNYEIGSIDDRKRLKLKAKPDVAPLNDKRELNRQFIDDQSDWVRFEAIVGTEPDQTAVAPGYLQRTWATNDRRYFHYKMDRPVANFFSFVSARYATRTDSWSNPAGGSPVAITVYYQPGHEYNLGAMIKGVKASLSYYSKHFAPYPDRQVRILEFPGYQSFAQSFVNTIPFSEAIGFVAKVDSTNPEDVDYPYYVTAHEMSHQWWGHQVMPANVEGSAVLSETMSQYAALMVMRQHVGPYQMQKFLQSELNRYLFGRSSEDRYERPLYRVGGQQHIYYQKGSMVMYGLAELMGEDSLNAAVGGYLRTNRFARPPYPTTPGWVAAIRKRAPDSLQNVITDGLERITLYENKVSEATSTPLPGGKWHVRLVIDAKKVYADSLGTERDVPLKDDWLPVAVFPERKRGAAPPKPLVFQYRRMRTGRNVLDFTTTQKPAKAGVDPYHVFIDRTLEDNVKEVSEEKAGGKVGGKG